MSTVNHHAFQEPRSGSTQMASSPQPSPPEGRGRRPGNSQVHGPNARQKTSRLLMIWDSKYFFGLTGFNWPADFVRDRGRNFHNKIFTAGAEKIDRKIIDMIYL